MLPRSSQNCFQWSGKIIRRLSYYKCIQYIINHFREKLFSEYCCPTVSAGEQRDTLALPRVKDAGIFFQFIVFFSVKKWKASVFCITGCILWPPSDGVTKQAFIKWILWPPSDAEKSALFLSKYLSIYLNLYNDFVSVDAWYIASDQSLLLMWLHP